MKEIDEYTAVGCYQWLFTCGAVANVIFDGRFCCKRHISTDKICAIVIVWRLLMMRSSYLTTVVLWSSMFWQNKYSPYQKVCFILHFFISPNKTLCRSTSTWLFKLCTILNMRQCTERQLTIYKSSTSEESIWCEENKV